MTVTSGRNILGLYKKLNRSVSLAKMLLGSSTWSSTISLLTWRAKVKPQSNLLFQLFPLMLLTDETEYGLLLTPTTIQSDFSETRYKKRKKYRESIGRHYTPGCLREQIMSLPTPTARDYKGARSSESLAKAGRNKNNSLPDQFNQPGKTSQLNPHFVEEMMGYPIGWTELNP